MNRGIQRYTKPVFYPVYGILVGYTLMWIVRWTTGIIPYEYIVIEIGNHGFTMADIFIITGAFIGGIFWYKKSQKDNQSNENEDD